VDLGYLEQFKVGKRLYFAPVRDLSRKLKPRKQTTRWPW
jgi:hypothetical protein